MGPRKVENVLKGCLDSIPSPFPSIKIQIMGGKVCLRCKGKTLLGFVNKLLKTKRLLKSPSNVLPLHIKQTFLLIIWIFTEGEGEGIESRLPYKIFSTLPTIIDFLKILLPTGIIICKKNHLNQINPKMKSRPFLSRNLRDEESSLRTLGDGFEANRRILSFVILWQKLLKSVPKSWRLYLF